MADFIPTKGLVMQLAKRALRRVHFESQLFSTGHSGATARDCRRINVGAGAEVALETTVGAALAQEFNASKMTHGWLTPTDNEKRFYVVDREVEYKLAADDTSKHIDIIIRRLPEPANGGIAKEYGILPIELKRARRYLPNLATGDRNPGAILTGEVAEDVAKLEAFATAWTAGTIECEYASLFPRTSEVFPHVLVWGIADGYTANKGDRSPARFIENAVPTAKLKNPEFEVGWIPVDWEPGTKDGPPAISSWLWIAYAEIRV